MVAILHVLEYYPAASLRHHRDPQGDSPPPPTVLTHSRRNHTPGQIERGSESKRLRVEAAEGVEHTHTNTRNILRPGGWRQNLCAFHATAFRGRIRRKKRVDPPYTHCDGPPLHNG